MSYPPGASPYGASFGGEVWVPPAASVPPAAPLPTAPVPLTAEADPARGNAGVDGLGSAVTAFKWTDFTASDRGWWVHRIVIFGTQTYPSDPIPECRVFIHQTAIDAVTGAWSLPRPSEMVAFTRNGYGDTDEPVRPYYVPPAARLSLVWTNPDPKVYPASSGTLSVHHLFTAHVDYVEA